MYGKYIIFACLLGFGATAINPYLALSSIRDMKLNENANRS
jgi:glutamate synthase (NADPH/NADH) large chain